MSAPPLIDPRAPREQGRFAPPMQVQAIPVFTAAHMVAFGTDYSMSLYFAEVSRLLLGGAQLTWGNDTAYYQERIAAALSEGDVGNVVSMYIDSRGLSREMTNAAQVLMEGCRRGELHVRAKRAASEQYQDLSDTDFLDRGWLHFADGGLTRCDQTGRWLTDWEDLLFRREEVETLRDAPWHTMGKVIQLTPSMGAGRGGLTAFVTSSQNLANARGDIAGRGVAETKGEFARVLARLYQAQTGGQTSPANIEATWRRSNVALDLEELQKLAAKGERQS